MTGGTKMTALTGKRQQVFMTAVFTINQGKTTLQIPAIHLTVDIVLSSITFFGQRIGQAT